MSTENPEQSLRTGDSHSADVLPPPLSSDLVALHLSSAGLNPTITEKLKEGDQVTVPNVKPFELSAVKPGSEAAAIVANELGEQDEKGQSKTGEAAEEVSKEETPPLSLYISTKEEILEVRDGEKLVAAFPVTVGSQDTASPIGHWTVKAIAKLPNFRYDLKMLNEGERSSSFYMLPPGPGSFDLGL